MLRTIERFAFKLLTGEFPEQYFARKLHKDQLMQAVFRSQAALEQELAKVGFAPGRDFISSFSLTHTEFQCSAEVQTYLKNGCGQNPLVISRKFLLILLSSRLHLSCNQLLLTTPLKNSPTFTNYLQSIEALKKSRS